MKTYYIRDFCKYPDFPLQILFRKNSEQKNVPFYEGKHRHDFIEIVYVESGSGWCSMNEYTVPCFPGDLYIMPLTCVHEFKILNSMQHYNLMIRADAFTPAERTLLKAEPYYSKIFSAHREPPTFCHLPLPVTAKLRMLLFSARECMQKEGNNFKIEFKSYILLILCEIFRLLRYASSQSSGQPESELEFQNISTVVDYMSSHYKETVTVAELANLVKMTPAGFIRFFHKKLGVPPIQYLNSLRILEACRLLVMPTEYSISEIAYMCGFSNSSYFAETFRKIMDMSPRVYRTQNRIL